MSEDSMRYDRLAQEAMRGVIRLALQRANSPEGLPGNHHFFISFETQFPGVQLPAHLLEEYPEEMTVIIKRRFWDLDVQIEGFSVGLSFSNQREDIQVPYAAITRFIDPEAQFALQFPVPNSTHKPEVDSTAQPDKESEPGDAEIVSLDAFRRR
ncbi:MAG: hypothetical protein KTR25_21095 [Myxococcales bacterium]|nr:hypothetical protein [Myxococcales bacterium]